MDIEKQSQEQCTAIEDIILEIAEEFYDNSFPLLDRKMFREGIYDLGFAIELFEFLEDKLGIWLVKSDLKKIPKDVLYQKYFQIGKTTARSVVRHIDPLAQLPQSVKYDLRRFMKKAY